MWWYDTSTQRLYQRLPRIIREYQIARPSRTRSSGKKFSFLQEVPYIPPSIPATARLDAKEITMTGVGTLQEKEEVIDSFKWLKESVVFPQNLNQMLGKQPHLIAVSDGSFKQEHGTAAWILRASEACEIVGQMITPGTARDQSAYRSELAGLYGVACTIWLLEKEHGITGTVLAACDGLSALRQIEKMHDFIDPNLPQYDLILAIRNIIRQTSWSWSWTHVKGHQDNETSFDNLDMLSQINVRMDQLAKEYWKQTLGQRSLQAITGEPWPLLLDGQKVTSNMREKLRDFCLSKGALLYWQKKRQFRSASVHDIDWDVFKAAMKGLPSGRQKWVTKMTTGFCATGVVMHRRGERATAECPRCALTEDVEHVWKCKSETDDIWNKALESLREWLNTHKTHPELSKQIIQGLNRWRSDEAGSSTSHIPWIQEVLSQQDDFGWGGFFEGFVARAWRQAHEKYLNRTKSPKSSKRWLSSLIRKQWQIAWDLWEHRNGYLHSKDENLISIEVNKKLEEEFRLGPPRLQTNTKALFAGGLAALESKPLEIRQQWIRRIQVAREKEGVAPQVTYRSERRLMSRWLGSASNLGN
jgi:hypothetical protein